MKTIGKVESLWRYPVKSMRGEQLPEAFVGFAGVVRRPPLCLSQCGRAEGFSLI